MSSRGPTPAFSLEEIIVSQKLLKKAGEALWGPQYRSEMARVLGIHLRTLMRYDAGERDVPQEILAKLAALLAKRRGHLDKVQVEIDAAVKGEVR